MRVTLELRADGTVLLDSRGVPAHETERALLQALAGLQRELTARRVAELVKPRPGEIVIPREVIPA